MGKGVGVGWEGGQAEWCNKSTGFALTSNFRFLPVKVSIYWNENQRSVAVILFDRFSKTKQKIHRECVWHGVRACVRACVRVCTGEARRKPKEN